LASSRAALAEMGDLFGAGMVFVLLVDPFGLDSFLTPTAFFGVFESLLALVVTLEVRG